MTSSYNVEAHQNGQSVTIPFGEKYAESEQFKLLFREGMALVEETATYLDGDGRADSKELTSQAALAYATESMRLTTRLMQLASWLLIRRAVNDGEMTPEQACEEKHKVKLQAIGRPAHYKGYAELPQKLKDLIEASFRMYERIIALDKLIHTPQEKATNTETVNPLNAQLEQLRSAFEYDYSSPQL